SPLHTRPVPAALRLITRHALMTYARKHWPVWQWCALGGLVWLEAWARQRWAGWRGRAEAEGHYAGLRALVADVMRGRGRAVRRRLREAARHLEAAAREADSP
ncbi:MAG TPA: hypothetical protein VIL46_15255, partial [Gemmataceae bacterium]